MQQKEHSETGREIVICASFREFDGGPNDRIQQMFLDSLARQSYRNFRLCVTNFRERLVLDRLKSCDFRWDFEQAKIDSRVSLTCILENGISKLTPGASILLYTNVDHVFPHDFLATLAAQFEPGCSGTFFPQIVYNSAEDFELGRPMYHPLASPAPLERGAFPPREEGLPSWLQLDPNYWVMDVTFADGDLMLDAAHRKSLEQHRFDHFWPGPTQSVLLTSYSPTPLRKNLFFQTRYAEIINVYGASAAADATRSYLDIRQEEFKTVDPLREVMRDFAKDARVDVSEFHDPLLAKIRHAERFSVVGSVAEQTLYAMYLAYWRSRYTLLGAYPQGPLPPQASQMLEEMKGLLKQFFENTRSVSV